MTDNLTISRNGIAEKVIPNIFEAPADTWDRMIPGEKEHYNEFRRNCYYEKVMPGGVSIGTDLWVYIVDRMAYLAATL